LSRWGGWWYMNMEYQEGRLQNVLPFNSTEIMQF
jgi:hypothetical protein